jgi:cytochrome c5
MRHHIVTRIVVSLAVLCVAAVAVFTWGVTRPVPSRPGAAAPSAAEPDGEALFLRHCAMCHEAADTGRSFRDAADREAAIEEFRAFLDDHYGPSPEGIVLIVSHLMDRGGT